MSGRVAIVLHEPDVGGATIAVLNPLETLEREGWEFCFWVPRPSPIAELLEQRGYLVAGEPRELRYSRAALRQAPGTLARARSVPGYLARFRRFIRTTRPDLVHVNTIVALPEALVARSTGVPTLLNVHEMLRGTQGSAAARLARLVDGVMTDSHACAAPLLAHGAHVDVVRPCIPSLSDAECPPQQARERLVVGTLATISKRKGSDVFVEAARMILERRDDVDFRMVGRLAGGADEPWARDVVARGELHGVTWGETSQPYSELLGWDVFALPTRADPFPLIVMQAMAAGLPVVASAVDGVCEQVDGASAFLVEPDDPAALATAIERLLDDPALRAAMGRAGAERIATTFAPERQASELVRAYEGAMTRGTHRGRLIRPLRPARASGIVRGRDSHDSDGERKPMSRPTALPPRPLRLLARRAMIAAQPVLRHSGLSARVGRELERRRAVITEPEPEFGPDGLPIPPPLLRVENVNTTDLDYFFERGAASAKAFAALSERHGLPMTDVKKLLDFGCGCGRVLRHWGDYPGVEQWGSDLSVPATQWIEANLPFAHARANGLQPPLPHDEETFDLIYAISVFTHLPLEIGEAWMAELRRLLRPGGLLMFTVHHDHYAPQLTRRERAAYERGEYVVQFAEAAGANICCSYHPMTYLEELTSDFELLEFAPPEQAPFLPQDLCIVRRPAAD